MLLVGCGCGASLPGRRGQISGLCIDHGPALSRRWRGAKYVLGEGSPISSAYSPRMKADPDSDPVTVDLVRVASKAQFIERVLAAVGVAEPLRAANWDAFEEQIREARRLVRLENLDSANAELGLGVRILADSRLLAAD